MDIKVRDEGTNLYTIVNRARNLAPIAEQLYDVAEQDFAKRFESSPSVETTAQVYGGVEWTRLAESTLKRNPKRRGGRILINTGELMNSFKRGRPGNVAEVSGSTIIFGSELPKAVYNNEKRPMNPVHPALAEAAGKVITIYILSGK